MPPLPGQDPGKRVIGLEAGRTALGGADELFSEAEIRVPDCRPGGGQEFRWSLHRSGPHVPGGDAQDVVVAPLREAFGGGNQPAPELASSRSRQAAPDDLTVDRLRKA